MDNRYRLGHWIIDNWSCVSLPFAVPTLCSLPFFSTGNNVPLILLYTLLPVYMIHQYEEHAHGRFGEFFNSTMSKGHDILTKAIGGFNWSVQHCRFWVLSGPEVHEWRG